MEYIITFCEALVYLNDCNKKGLFIIKNEEKKYTKLVPSMKRRFYQGTYDSWSVLLQWEFSFKKDECKKCLN